MREMGEREREGERERQMRDRDGSKCGLISWNRSNENKCTLKTGIQKKASNFSPPN